MRLPLLSRLKVEGARPVARWVMKQPWLRNRLAGTRAESLALGLDEDVAIMLAMDDRISIPIQHLSPRTARLRLTESIAMAEDPPAGAVTVGPRVIPGPKGPISARHYEPAGQVRPAPALVYIHGGGWVTGDLDSHDSFCRKLAVSARLSVLAVEPRLAPEDPFPAAVDDSVAAFRWAAEHADALGFDRTRLGVGGDSAGGNLSAVVGLVTRGDAVKPAATILVYPAVDATRSHPSHARYAKGYFLTRESIDWYLGHYAGPEHYKDPRLSPLFEEDLRGAPPALVAVAGFDPLVDEGVHYAELLAKAGVPVELFREDSLPHGFTLMTGLSARARAATDHIVRRTGELLADPKAARFAGLG